VTAAIDGSARDSVSEHATSAVSLDDELLRLAARIIDEVTALSPDVEGVSRPAYSAVESRVIDYLAGIARQYGLTTWTDPAANLVIAAPGDDPGAERYGLIGSHADSVPQGGRFDGLAGVVAGLLTLIAWHKEGSAPRLPVRLLVLRGEESAWFGHAYMGSRALLGRLEESALGARRRGSEETLKAAMAEVGVPVDTVANGEPLIDASAVAFFLEAHIEQGPLLVARDWPVAAVTAIRGNIRYPELQCIGEAGHSGTVPRWLRQDAVFATAELITRMDEHWVTIQEHGGDLVLTVGILHTDPQRNAMSRIPGEVTLSLEVRSQDMPTLNAIDALVRSECHVIERERGVRFHFEEPIMVEPAALDKPIIDAIKQACLAEGLPAEAVPSGAGHDAAVFAQAGVPTGLLFIRNRHGSHNPREDMDLPDLMAAASVLRRVALELADD
jgi:beta-ureidopropionase / N-carbamoyl-L-amino-acid hydrolase